MVKISKPDLVNYRQSLLSGKGAVSVTSAEHHFWTVKSIWKSAAQDDVIDKNVAQYIKPLKAFEDEESEERRRPFTYEEVQKILPWAAEAQAKGKGEWLSMVLFGYYTGARLRDLAFLRWNSIDLQNNFIRFKTRKTGQQLTVGMSPELREHLLGMVRPIDSGAYVHPVCARDDDLLSNQFRSILYKAGLIPKPWGKKENVGAGRKQRGLCFHSFRHIAISDLKAAGIAQATVMATVGHNDLATNMGYTHTAESEITKAALSRKPLGLQPIALSA
jgi:integrase